MHSKKDLNISLAVKILKSLNLYAYFFKKWVHIRETVLKPNICPFLIMDDEFFEIYNEIWEKFESEPAYNEKYLEAKIKS